jgi:hypothetical protein
MVNALLEARDDYAEYVDLCLEACTYNEVTESFNDFFTSSDAFDESKMIKALQLYAVHLQLLYSAFGSENISQTQVYAEISAFVDSMLPLLSSAYGNMESILMFKESLDSLCEYYIGAGYYNAANDVAVWEDYGQIGNGAATSIFFKYYESVYDASSEHAFYTAPGLAMQFDNILDCWPNIIMSEEVATGLEVADDYTWEMEEMKDTGWTEIEKKLSGNDEKDAIYDIFYNLYWRAGGETLGDGLQNFRKVNLDKGVDDDWTFDQHFVNYVLVSQWVVDWIQDNDSGDLSEDTDRYHTALVIPMYWVNNYVTGHYLDMSHSGTDPGEGATFWDYISLMNDRLEDNCVYFHCDTYGLASDMSSTDDWRETEDVFLNNCPLYASNGPVIVVNFGASTLTSMNPDYTHEKDKAWRIRAYTSTEEFVDSYQYYGTDPTD